MVNKEDALMVIKSIKESIEMAEHIINITFQLDNIIGKRANDDGMLEKYFTGYQDLTLNIKWKVKRRYYETNRIDGND